MIQSTFISVFIIHSNIIWFTKIHINIICVTPLDIIRKKIASIFANGCLFRMYIHTCIYIHIKNIKHKIEQKND